MLDSGQTMTVRVDALLLGAGLEFEGVCPTVQWHQGRKGYRP